jgi:hypothetical protein
MFSWLFTSRNNDDNFINAIINNLIDTEDIRLNIYRASNRKYFDVQHYPIPKMPYSPIWFSLKKEDVESYVKTYDRNTKNPDDEVIFLEYEFRPNYKILKIRNDDGQLNKELMKILVDHVVDKIKNDEDKKINILNQLKSDIKFKHWTYDQYSENLFSDTEIIKNVLNTFKGIYSNQRTSEKIIDELLFQEIINEMMRLNLIERYELVGFWNGFTVNDSPEPTPEEIIIIGNRMRDCLVPIVDLITIDKKREREINSYERQNKRTRRIGGKKSKKYNLKKSKKYNLKKSKKSKK